jgi:hypothetical protein
MVDNFNILKRTTKSDTDALLRLKAETSAETAALTKTIQEARQIQHNLQSEIDDTGRTTIQTIDSKMPKAERAIHATLQKRGKGAIASDAKIEMTSNMEEQMLALERKLSEKTNDIFHEATTLLDQAAMQISAKNAANFQPRALKVAQFVSCLSSKMESLDLLRFRSRAGQPTDESYDRLTRLGFRLPTAVPEFSRGRSC